MGDLMRVAASILETSPALEEEVHWKDDGRGVLIRGGWGGGA